MGKLVAGAERVASGQDDQRAGGTVELDRSPAVSFRDREGDVNPAGPGRASGRLF